MPQSEIRSALSFGGFGTVGSRRVYGAPWIQGALGSEVGLLSLYVFSLRLAREGFANESVKFARCGRQGGWLQIRQTPDHARGTRTIIKLQLGDVCGADDMQTVRWPLWTSSQAQSKDTARPLLGAVFRVKGFGPWFSGGGKDL